MTKSRRLVPLSEVTGLLDTLKTYGINLHSIDVRNDGVTVYGLPPSQVQDSFPVLTSLRQTSNATQKPSDAYDEWKKAQEHP